LLSLALLAAIAALLIVFIQQRLEDVTLQLVSKAAAEDVASFMESEMSASDLSGMLRVDRFAEIDSLIRQYVLGHRDIVRIKIWSSDGVVIYSDEEQLVGQRFPVEGDLAEALSGRVVAETSALDQPEHVYERDGFGRLFEVYVPVRVSDSARILGVFEIYQNLDLLYPQIVTMRRVVGAGIGGGFLVLYLSLFAIVRSASRSLVLRNRENARLFKETKRQLTELKVAGEELEDNYRIQSALGAMLSISLLNVSLEEQLQKILERILALPWLTVESKGCVFLVEGTAPVLSMKAQVGLAPSLLTMCAQVAFGRCLCGKAAETGQLVHADRVDERHENVYEGISPHGHYCVPVASAGTLLGVLNLYLREGHGHDAKEEDFLRAVADVLAGIIERANVNESLRHTADSLREALTGTVQAMALVVETRDAYTAGHQQRVASLARAIAIEMELSEHRKDGIYLAATIHDVGKVSVPAEILSKPGRISDIEMALIKAHPQTGHDILAGIEFPWPVAELILQHHERMDGSGYPQGLEGEEILIGARILAVADVVEAMASHRPYRPALGVKAALGEIESKKGVVFDPKVVDECIRLFGTGFSFSDGDEA